MKVEKGSWTFWNNSRKERFLSELQFSNKLHPQSYPKLEQKSLTELKKKYIWINDDAWITAIVEYNNFRCVFQFLHVKCQRAQKNSIRVRQRNFTFETRYENWLQLHAVCWNTHFQTNMAPSAFGRCFFLLKSS